MQLLLDKHVLLFFAAGVKSHSFVTFPTLNVNYVSWKVPTRPPVGMINSLANVGIAQ